MMSHNVSKLKSMLKIVMRTMQGRRKQCHAGWSNKHIGHNEDVGTKEERRWCKETMNCAVC